MQDSKRHRSGDSQGARKLGRSSRCDRFGQLECFKHAFSAHQEDGNPTGVFIADPSPNQFYSLLGSLPKFDEATAKVSTEYIFRELARFSLTSVIDAGGGGFNFPNDYSVPLETMKVGKLPLRVSFYLFTQHPGKELEDYQNWMKANHAGDNLDVIEKVNTTTPLNGLRWAIDHAETPKEKNADRIKALGGGVAVQDCMYFLGDDFTQRYGKNSAQESPPVRMLLSKGIPIGMGTDGTRSSFNPWLGR